MNVQELETISYNKLPVKIFIINNQGYGLIKGTQELFLKKNYVGVDSSSGLGLPDFKKIAYSYNINYCSIKNHNELRKKIRFAVNSKNTIIIKCLKTCLAKKFYFCLIPKQFNTPHKLFERSVNYCWSGP